MVYAHEREIETATLLARYSTLVDTVSAGREHVIDTKGVSAQWATLVDRLATII